MSSDFHLWSLGFVFRYFLCFVFWWWLYMTLPCSWFWGFAHIYIFVSDTNIGVLLAFTTNKTGGNVFRCLSILRQVLSIISNPSVNWNWSYSPETLNSGRNLLYSVLCDFQIWWMSLENNGRVFHAKSSFIHHFRSIGEVKLELQSGNAKFVPKLAISCPAWTWKLMNDLEKQKGTSSILHQALWNISKPWVKSNWSCNREMLNLGQNRQFVVPCDLEMLQMTLKDNKAPFPMLLQACASFVAIGEFKLELQSGNAQFGSKSTIFFSRVNLKLDGWPWETIGHLF